MTTHSPHANSPNDHTLEVQVKDEKEIAAANAKVFLAPSINSAIVISECNSNQGLELTSLIAELRHQSQQVFEGNLEKAEAMLISQAHALDTIFRHMMIRSFKAEYLKPRQIFTHMALKAQSQCRQTLSALGELKRPSQKTVINNKAQNQQVNLHQATPQEPPAVTNELLSEAHDAPMDGIGTAAASGADSSLEAVEAGRG